MQTEIVTKAVIGKGKKSFNNKYEFLLSEESSGVLGCYILNHKINAFPENGNIRINGSFDTNIWYSYDNNTKTKVEVQRINYSELLNINLKEGTSLNDNSEIEVHAIKNPTVIDVTSSKNILKYETLKELAIEVLGNAKVKIQTIESSNEEYKDLLNEVSDNDIDNIVDNEVNTEYLG